MMMKKPLPQKTPNGHDREKQLLTLELAEIREISEILFTRLDRKIKTLESLEASIDRKVLHLERLMQAGNSLGDAAADLGKQHQIASLSARGMRSTDIAEVLHLPVGEVELVLALGRQSA